MASFTSKLFKRMIMPVLTELGSTPKNGPDGWLSLIQALTASAPDKNTARPAVGKTKYGTAQRGNASQGKPMGALLKFILMNAVTVIGAKLINEASERAGAKLFTGKQKDQGGKTPPDAPTLETRTCPHCGAFRVRGEPCACQS